MKKTALPKNSMAALGANLLGFTLLELIIVVALIAILSATAIPFYLRTIDRAERLTVQLSANYFATNIGFIRAQYYVNSNLGRINSVDNKNIVNADPYSVLVNDSGWSVGAYLTDSKGYDSAKQCQSLWDGIINSPTEKIVGAGHAQQINTLKKNEFTAHKISEFICRFILITKHNSKYYFDYHLMDGRIDTSFESLD